MVSTQLMSICVHMGTIQDEFILEMDVGESCAPPVGEVSSTTLEEEKDANPGSKKRQRTKQPFQGLPEEQAVADENANPHVKAVDFWPVLGENSDFWWTL